MNIMELKDNQITKDRIKKSYRLKVIDEKLRKSRTKSETFNQISYDKRIIFFRENLQI